MTSSIAAGLRVEDYEGICQTIVATFYPPSGEEHDDLMQFARVGVWRGLKSYDETRHRNSSRFKWVAYCARKEVQSGLTAARRQKHRALNEADRFERTADTESGTATLGEIVPSRFPGPAEATEIAIDLRNAIRDATTFLSETEQRAVIGNALGFIYEELGPPKMMDNALQRGRKKLVDLAA